jgi:CheY-like chemotaxis protein
MAKKLILIVEDDARIRESLGEVFEGEGYPIKTAQNGKEALSVLRILEDLPGLICLDLMMPEMDGQAFLVEIQKKTENVRFKNIPVAIISAARQEVFGNIVAYLRKPPQIDQLIQLAEKYAGA